MKSNLYVITDVKAGRTTEPFSCPSDEVAKRNFLMGCFGSCTPPQDCNLWKVGEFFTDDSDSSVFSVSQNIKLIPCTVEETEAYLKQYQMFHPEDMEVEA